MASEFDLIRRHFSRPTRHTDLAGGDDCALIRVAPGQQLAISTDMLVAGTHFFPDTDPEALGWKTLAVNLSDLAAMGAVPRWATLAIALPAADEAWLTAFAHGFYTLADQFEVDLIGGDTTRGPLNLAPTVFGEVPAGEALRRDGAQIGDEVWVSGMPGLAALGLAQLRGEAALPATQAVPALAALYRPQPRVALGLALRGVASACIDVSDGLLGDLAHILERSGVSAEVFEAALPDGMFAGVDPVLARRCRLSGGDDYELCFTAPPARADAVHAAAAQAGVPVSRIGRIKAGNADGLRVRDATGRVFRPSERGYDHFGG